MTTFVLVAGAWHGAWAWKRLEPLLAAKGHEIIRIDLTGQGARAHTVTPDTDLSTHIEDVVACFEMEDIERAVLVGHSYSGMVVTGAATRLGDRVSHLVYADAMVPSDGQSAADYAGPDLTAVALAKAEDH
jgi:pimeloyl-ACP methyl ester carboxylesterase